MELSSQPMLMKEIEEKRAARDKLNKECMFFDKQQQEAFDEYLRFKKRA